jgi:hypothetical protein
MPTLSKSRIGKFTASEIHKLFTGGITKTTYIEMVAEEMTTGIAREFSNKHTDHGHMHEHEAITNFMEVSGLNVENLMQEFFEINENCGATPDAKVIDFSGNLLASCDVKCPTTTFFKQKMIFINSKKPEFQNVPKEFFYQAQMQMMAMGVNEHYLVRYLTAMDTDYYGNTVEYDLPLNVRLFYQKIIADKRIQNQILYIVSEAAKERDLLVKIYKSPIV